VREFAQNGGCVFGRWPVRLLVFRSWKDSCPLKDVLPAIKTRMKNADDVIVVSPVYVDDVSGIMKNWIDRPAHVCRRPNLLAEAPFLCLQSGAPVQAMP
jgi:multimeric flavodoxin WrbA